VAGANAICDGPPDGGSFQLFRVAGIPTNTLDDLTCKVLYTRAIGGQEIGRPSISATKHAGLVDCARELVFGTGADHSGRLHPHTRSQPSETAPSHSAGGHLSCPLREPQLHVPHQVKHAR
jgi:hypothetical protein